MDYKVNMDFGTGLVTFKAPSELKANVKMLGAFLEDDSQKTASATSVPTESSRSVCVIAPSCDRNLVILKLPSTEQMKIPEKTPEDHLWKPSGVVKINEELTDNQIQELSALVDAYAGVFSSGPEDRIRGVHNRIDTGDAQPVNRPPYRVSPPVQDEIERQTSSMLEAGLIRESQSPSSSPVVLADKPDGSSRFCVNYQKLNEITKKDRYPIPRVDDSLDSLAGNLYFSLLDMRTGFRQIPIAQSDIEKTAFATPAGLFEFLVMPFGLCNAPSTFQRAMDLD